MIFWFVRTSASIHPCFTPMGYELRVAGSGFDEPGTQLATRNPGRDS